MLCGRSSSSEEALRRVGGCLMADIPVSAIVASDAKILDEESPMKQVTT